MLKSGGKTSGFKLFVNLCIILVLILASSIGGIWFGSEGRWDLVFHRVRTHAYQAMPVELGIALLKAKRHLKFGSEDLGGHPALAQLSIQVEPAQYAKLERDIRDSNSRKVPGLPGIFIKTKEAKKYVPGVLDDGDKSYKMELRLKGDWTDHTDPLNPSFRIEMSNGRWQGMERFSVQKPVTRNFLGEWLFLKALRDENIIAPRYDFVRLKINGIDRGIYAVEEFFAKQMLESMGRLEAPIMKLDEDLLWKSRALYDGGFEYPKELPVRFFGEKKIAGNNQQKLLSEVAYANYEAYRNKTKPFCHVFDCPKFARYSAITDLFQTSHGYQWHNWRFYFNPLTTLFEPIGFDGDAFKGGNPDATIQFIQRQNDRALMSQYQRALAEVTSDKYIDALWSFNLDSLKKYDVHLLHDYYSEFYLPLDSLLKNLRHHAAIQRKRFDPPAHVDVRHSLDVGDGKSQVRIDIASQVPFPVAVEKISLGKTKVPSTAWQSCKGEEPWGNGQFILDGGEFGAEGLQYKSICIGLDTVKKATVKVEVKTSVPGLDIEKEHRSVAFMPVSHESIGALRFASAEDLAAKFEFIEIDAAEKILRIRPGSWEVAESIHVPQHYTLVAGPGTTLVLARGVNIFSFSPLRFVGEPLSPVVLKARDESWGAIAVLDAGSGSVWRHVVVSRASEHPGTPFMTGGILFYRSEVAIDDVSIQNAQGEDAINIKESNFTIKDLNIETARSDGVDIDFSNGSIAGLRVVSTGNDGLDLSGSEVEVDGVECVGVGDKCLSLGEGSDVRGSNISLMGAFIGIAGKDASRGRFTKLKNFSIAKFPFVVYSKKEDYGPASLSVDDRLEEGGTRNFVLQQGSSLTVDGAQLHHNRPEGSDVSGELERAGLEYRR